MGIEKSESNMTTNLLIYLPHIFILPILYLQLKNERAGITIRQRHKHLNKIRFGTGMASAMLDNDAARFWF